MAEAYFKHAKRGRFEDEDSTEMDTGVDYFVMKDNRPTPMNYMNMHTSVTYREYVTVSWL